VNLADLFLAFEARSGSAPALAELDRRLRAACALVRNRDTLELDELVQRVRERVLVGGPRSPPRLAAYAGKGALVKWLQAVAATTAIDARRAAAGDEEAGDDALVKAASGWEAADVQLGDAQSRRVFARAFKAALTGLNDKERTVLRLRHVDRANLDEIALLYKVHRTTVMRWLEQTHAQVLGETRRAMAAELGLRGKALDSLIRGVELSFADRVSQLLGRAP
jgi:RNA polymerase sigma-70 factor (ECF subfamily)